jgi:hypothetical protein
MSYDTELEVSKNSDALSENSDENSLHSDEEPSGHNLHFRMSKTLSGIQWI